MFDCRAQAPANYMHENTLAEQQAWNSVKHSFLLDLCRTTLPVKATCKFREKLRRNEQTSAPRSNTEPQNNHTSGAFVQKHQEPQSPSRLPANGRAGNPVSSRSPPPCASGVLKRQGAKAACVNWQRACGRLYGKMR